MSTLKVTNIQQGSASSSAIVLATDGTCTAKVTNNLSNRNLIINGSFQICQRSVSSTDGNYKTVDRWKHNHGGTDENPTYAQIDLDSSDAGPWAKGFRKAFKFTNGNQTGGAGADDYIQVMQAIEAQNIAKSGWDYTSTSSYITLSFWIKSSVAQAFAGHLRTADGTSKAYSFSTGSLSANTWTKVTKTIPGASGLQFDNNNAVGLYFYIFGFMGTNLTSSFTTESWANASSTNYANPMTSTWWTTNDATLAITGVQLEVGDTATDFEHLSYADDLRKCQRYYLEIARGDDKVIGLCMFYNDTGVRTAIRYPVQMRTTPSIETSNSAGHFACLSGDGSGSGSGTQSSAFATFDTSPAYADDNAIVIANTVADNNQNGQAGYIATQHADAYLCLSAEL
jgi:hypothetical protein